MFANLQDIAAGAVVLAAIVYLAMRVRRVLAQKRAASCGGCGTCATDSSQPLVTINPLPPGEGGERPRAG
jgi:hypothetical protein